MNPGDRILTSDIHYYYLGQFFLWGVLTVGLVVLARCEVRSWLTRAVLFASLALAFLSSFAPLVVRMLIAQPGLGGPDAGAEEAWLSFFATLPQALAVAALIWAVCRMARDASARTEASTHMTAESATSLLRSPNRD